MNLVQYQSEAVEKLVQGFKELIVAAKPNAAMILHAPTGSGKTVMTAAMLEQLLTENLDDEFVFIWASVGDLSHQSYLKLKYTYLPESEYDFQELESLPADALEKNTVLFCNWEKMFRRGKETDDEGNQIEIFTNVFVRIGEDGRNLQEVLEKTREAGRKIVLIVDEAHKTYLGPNSQRLVQEVIKPNLVLEVSATPSTKFEQGYYENNTGRYVKVPIRDVIESGLIKNNTIINNDIAGVVDKNSADTAVLAAALKQRKILAEKYRQQGANINPLVLVQLPTDSSEKMSEADQTTRETVEQFMDENGINYDNGKLAIWVSGDHYPEDVKTSVIQNDSPIEVLIFKQAIATGWDCPRASILVMLRDIKSVTFEIQTVGRILRMPELKHYDDASLNTAYVYTNINQIALQEDADTQTFFKTRFSHKLPEFRDNFCMPNIYRKRVVGQRHRLNRNFRKKFFPKLKEKFQINKEDDKNARLQKLDALLEIATDELTIPVLANVSFGHLDAIDQELFEQSQRVKLTADKPYIERVFNLFLKSASSPYAPHDSSRVLKDAIYKWFSDNGIDDESEVQRIIACSVANQEILNSIIDDAKEEFAKTMGKETELTYTDFRIPDEQEFGEKYEAFPMRKHVLQPYYRHTENRWKTEERFESLLDNSDSVVWWYRNGTSEPKYFGVPYYKNDDKGIEESIFYPDYIVRFTDGTLGIFDTKSGDTTKPGTTLSGSVDEKADGLQAFFRDYTEIANLYREPQWSFDITDMTGLWGGIINMAADGHFELQGNAVTQEMARAQLRGEKIEFPESSYDPNDWNRFIIQG